MRPPLIALLAAAVAALVTGAALGAREPEPATPARDGATRGDPAPGRAGDAGGRSQRADAADAARRTAERLPLGELAGAVVLMRFTGTPEPAYVRGALRAGRAAGVILFRDNTGTLAATRALTRRLQDAARVRPVLISTDQEGGPIRNLAWAPPSNAASSITTRAGATAASRAAARGLAAAGVNVNLAPVADLSGPGPVMRARAFPGGPAHVARVTAAAVRAYAASGVAPTVKHFPGLGSATANTDDTSVIIDRGARAIGATDLPPFRAAIAAGAPIVMVSHARYPSLDPAAIASQSRPIVTDLLKRRLGFTGVAVTDSIEAEAVRATMGPGRAAVRSVRAGVDLVLTTGPGSHLRVWRALRRRARADRAFRARLTDAAARVLALRRSVAGGAG